MNTTKRLVRIAIFAAILFIQEEALSFLPNIQLTQCLIAVYYYAFGLVDSIFIVLIHVLLDNLVMGSFNLLYTPAMIIGWITLPLLLHAFRFTRKKWLSATIVAAHGIVYSLGFTCVSVYLYQVPFLAYWIADIPWEVLLVVNGFLTTFLLLEPLTRILKKNFHKEKEEKIIHYSSDDTTKTNDCVENKR